MQQLFITSRSAVNRAISPSAALPIQMRVGKFFLMFAMTFLIGLLSFFYLVEFTKIHTKGYQLRKLEIARTKLLNARETKNTEIARLRSLSEVRDSDVAARLIPAVRTVFVKTDTSVAALGQNYRNP